MMARSFAKCEDALGRFPGSPNLARSSSAEVGTRAFANHIVIPGAGACRISSGGGRAHVGANSSGCKRPT